ncbi:MAG: hypothetical protein Q9193_003607 [Seirophora villosa]
MPRSPYYRKHKTNAAYLVQPLPNRESLGPGRSMLRDEVESDFDNEEVPDPEQKVQSPCTTLELHPPAINHEAGSLDTDHEVESPYIDAELLLPVLDSKVQPPYIHHEIQLSLEEDEPCQSLGEASAADLVQLSPQTKQTKPRPVHFGELPTEVLDRIVSYLAGPLMGPTSKSSCGPRGPRNAGTAMWHPRRKQLSNLALVSIVFRDLMQQRIYRHVKVKGTVLGLKECREWFCENPHLRAYVRHFEVWIPVWEVKARRRPTEIPLIPSAFTPRPDMRGKRVNGRTLTFKGDISDMTQGFQQSTQNASLEDILELTRDIFSELYVLTLEGGQGKRTPTVRAHRRRSDASGNTGHILMASARALRVPVNKQIRCLVLKGAWNIVREPPNFFLLLSALPNLQEYHCTYAKAKPQAYETTCCVFNGFPASIRHCNVCLEGLTSKPGCSAQKWRQLFSKCHICHSMGHILPHLESFSYTGRICGSMFETANEVAQHFRDPSRLQSVDIIVRNCCRPGAYPRSSSDATGIYQPDFIAAFIRLVTEAIRALIILTSVNYLRIRYLDLDSPRPMLNPYFHLQGTSVKGIYNFEINRLLRDARPYAEWDDTDMFDGTFEPYGNCPGTKYVDHLLKVGRPRRINVDAYTALLYDEMGL